MHSFRKYLVCCFFLGFYLTHYTVVCGNKANQSITFNENEVPLEVQLLNGIPGQHCNRVCEKGDKRICYFKFYIEHYQAMGVACGDCMKGNDADCDHPQCVVGDGFERGAMSTNRQIPGLAIHVCHNDHVIVDVVNKAFGEAVTMHWHGLHMRKTPWMDGVPFVTQCPIPYATTFRYQFFATEPGTQFYHSHSGFHKPNGQYGALIIRQPKDEDPHSSNYDFDLPEHYMLISEWMHWYANDRFPGRREDLGFLGSLAINGRGSYIELDGQRRKSAPPTRYYVKPRKRYRFRIINAISISCQIQIQVEQHRMVVIASDSFNTQPALFDTVVVNGGERYDFVLETNQPPADYWIRVSGMNSCSRADSFALLRYIDGDVVGQNEIEKPLPDMPSFDNTYPIGVMLNHPKAKCFEDSRDQCVTQLKALKADTELYLAKPDYTFFLSGYNYLEENDNIFIEGQYPQFVNPFDEVTIVGAINNISFVFPHSPLLTQPGAITNAIFCDEFNKPQHCSGKGLCECVHRLHVKLGSIVELIIVDETNIPLVNHPFHLHGHAFIIIGLGQNPTGGRMTAEMAKELHEKNSLLSRKVNQYPPLKDTVSIPSDGYGVLRFRASNPGYWLMHCHFVWHLVAGMNLVIQVGENHEMIPPPTNFPQCGSYLPGVLEGMDFM